MGSWGFKIIQLFQKDSDALYYGIVEPHYAFVFPLAGIKKAEFLQQIRSRSLSSGPIDFIPHVGIANDPDQEMVKGWVDSWNRVEFVFR